MKLWFVQSLILNCLRLPVSLSGNWGATACSIFVGSGGWQARTYSLYVYIYMRVCMCVRDCCLTAVVTPAGRRNQTLSVVIRCDLALNASDSQNVISRLKICHMRVLLHVIVAALKKKKKDTSEVSKCFVAA